MPVSLSKVTRSFTVLMQDGTVHGVLLTPDTQEDRDLLYFDAYWGDCLDLVEVTAVDAYAASIRAIALHDRATAIADYMDRVGVSYREARAAYRRCRTWARTLTRQERARMLTHHIKRHTPLLHFALVEAMRDLDETCPPLNERTAPTHHTHRNTAMPAQPFRISNRIHPHHFPDHQGGGQADHMRYINGRPFYFEWFWNAEGAVLLRVRTLVPNPVPGIAEGWQTVHEFAFN